MKTTNIFTLFILAVFLSGPSFAKNDKNKDKRLPPGLQKKASKGKPLPPGWQKKLAKGEILDREVVRRSEIVVPLDSRGLVTIRVEGKLVKLYKATREVAEVLKD